MGWPKYSVGWPPFREFPEPARNFRSGGVRRRVLLTGKRNRQWNPEQVIYPDSSLSFGVATIRAKRDNMPDLLTSTCNGANAAQFFVNDTVGGFYGGCALPDSATGFNLCTVTTSSSNTGTFKISAAGQTTARKIEVWIDGVKQYEQLASFGFFHYAFMQKAVTLATASRDVLRGWLRQSATTCRLHSQVVKHSG